MRNISVPTNDTMVFAVHGNTVDECIADCAKLMAYLTSGAQPETTVDDDYDTNDYDDYELDDDEDDDTVDDDEYERALKIIEEIKSKISELL